MILGLHPANERRYKVIPPLIGWVQTLNQPFNMICDENVMLAMKLNTNKI